MKHNAKETLEKEPGVLKFVLGEDSHEKNIFFFHTRYRCQADFEHHKTTPHFAEYKKLSASDPYSEPPVVQFFEGPGPAKRVCPPRPTVCRDIEFRIKPELRDSFLNFLEEHSNDPLCLDSVFGESIQGPNCFYLHEQYGAHKKPRALWDDFESGNAFAKPAIVNEYRNILCDC